MDSAQKLFSLPVSYQHRACAAPGCTESMMCDTIGMVAEEVSMIKTRPACMLFCGVLVCVAAPSQAQVTPDPVLSPDAVPNAPALSPDQMSAPPVLVPGTVPNDPALSPDQMSAPPIPSPDATPSAPVRSPDAVRNDPALSPD